MESVDRGIIEVKLKPYWNWLQSALMCIVEKSTHLC